MKYTDFDNEVRIGALTCAHVVFCCTPYMPEIQTHGGLVVGKTISWGDNSKGVDAAVLRLNDTLQRQQLSNSFPLGSPEDIEQYEEYVIVCTPTNNNITANVSVWLGPQRDYGQQSYKNAMVLTGTAFEEGQSGSPVYAIHKDTEEPILIGMMIAKKHGSQEGIAFWINIALEYLEVTYVKHE